ncbi:hypothetical protein BM1_01284 [Bipolaris maydis]|nr:hypothetical protein BM1_01284 [Bipolaris maydis]
MFWPWAMGFAFPVLPAPNLLMAVANANTRILPYTSITKFSDEWNPRHRIRPSFNAQARRGDVSSQHKY